MRLLACLWLIFVSVSVSVAQITPTGSTSGPLSPEDSLKHLVLADPNLVIELVAAEPEVIDPVSIQFDEHGRLWVVEMCDYPTGPKEAPPPLGGPDAKPLSRIKLLEDKDGDGRFETAHVFAENLLFATGVQPWDGGVIVTHSGEIVYLKDTDGDHKADVREVWFTGFSEQNTQLRANHPTFGPDGWIYVANGLRGGNVIAVKKDWPVKAEGLGVRGQGLEKDKAQSPASPPLLSSSPPHSVSHDPANPVPVSLTGRDFKFDPLTGRYEVISGNGQHGLTFDAWGNRFVCDNRHPCRHVIFEEDFIRLCPHVAFPAVVNDVIPPDDKNQVFPLTSAWTTSNLHAGTFTAACGVCVYTGDWLPEEFRGNVFVCEPTGNLVQRAILEPDGVTFKSRNPYVSGTALAAGQTAAESTTRNAAPQNAIAQNATPPAASAVPLTGREFLASRDDWFRPVDLQNGPDGALYVVDMYRAVIEHPEWVPDELKKRPDAWLGNDKGRIYRIRPKGSRRATHLAALRSEPVRSFDSLNGWRRMTASRLSHQQLQRGDDFVIHPLVSEEGHVLVWQSARLSGLKSAPDYAKWFFSTYSQAKIAAIRRLYDGIYVAADQDDVRFVAAPRIYSQNPLESFESLKALFLSEWDPKPDHEELRHVVFSHSEHSSIRLAVTGAVGDDVARFLEHIPSGFDELGRGTVPTIWEQSGVVELFGMLSEQVGKRASDTDVAKVVALLLAVSHRDGEGPYSVALSGLIGLAQGLLKRGDSFPKRLLSLGESVQQDIGKLNDRATLTLLTDATTVNDSQKRLIVRWLRYSGSIRQTETLRLVVERSSDQSLRLAALESFASFQKSEVDTWLIDRYPAETPAIRRAILALLASKERQLRLLEAIEQGQIAATELGPVQVNQLTQSKDETVRERAKTILAAAAPASRKEVLEAYQPALSLTGDAKRGRELFVKNCTTCHRVDNVGVNVAPDISDTRTKKPEQLLLDILDPNKAIDANYFAYAVVTKEGKVESGVISSESSNSITLKQPEGKTLTLLRSDIEELKNTGLSLMPVGVEKNLDQQAMADLIFWLKNWRYLDGKVPATSLK